MSRSLSAIVPVQNAQSELPTLATQLLEVLAELTPRFDLLILDHGSVDATTEMALDLASRYPQVRVQSYPTRQSRGSILQTALRQTRGELVLIRDEQCALDLQDLHKLWANMGEYDVVLARPAWVAPRGGSGWGSWAHKMRSWSLRSGQMPTEVTPGFGLLRRHALAALSRMDGTRRQLRSELSEGGLAWHEVDVRRDRRIPAPHVVAVPGGRQKAEITAKASTTASQAVAATGAARKLLEPIQRFVQEE